MLTETGKVVAVEPGAVWVETRRSSTCGNCELRGGCGHSLLARLGRRPMLVRAVLSPGQPSNPTLHDEVRIGIPERGFLRGAFLLYLWPLLSTVFAAVLASYALVTPQLSQAQADLRVTLAALAGLGLGLLLVRWRTVVSRTTGNLTPIVTGTR